MSVSSPQVFDDDAADRLARRVAEVAGRAFSM